MADQFVFTDRYRALGMDYPNPSTVCGGECEGVGFYPECDEEEPLWQEAHRRNCSLFGRFKRVIRTRSFREWACDGWHFVKCPHCNGTGKHPSAGAERG